MHELVNVPAMLGVVAGYLVLLVLVGAFFYKRSLVSEESRADFLLAGRSLGKLVTVGTIFATYVGGGTVTGGGNSLAYKFGFWPGVCFAIAPIFSLTILCASRSDLSGYWRMRWIRGSRIRGSGKCKFFG